jgi:hypothetical protein
MKNNSLSAVETALREFAAASQHLANVIDETGYEFQSAPDHMQEMDDFAYETTTFVEDEIQSFKKDTKLFLVKGEDKVG